MPSLQSSILCLVGVGNLTHSSISRQACSAKFLKRDQNKSFESTPFRIVQCEHQICPRLYHYFVLGAESEISSQILSKTEKFKKYFQ